MNDLKNKSLYDRVNKLLVSYEWSDCSFSVHGKKFKAHKLILGISSPVFEAMFYGPLSTNEVITITDIEPNIFQLLLNYIYTDKVDIHSIEESYDLMYAARKYMLDYLTEICIAYIESNMSIDNVIPVLNYPDHMQDNQLVKTALKLFCQHAGYFLKENKCSITSICMRKILECNEINILEKDLIKNVFEWTSYYCEQNEIKNNFQNRREILIKNDLLNLLRFSTLSLNELSEITACKDNLLLKYEEKLIKSCKKINNKMLSITDYNLLPRLALKLQWCLCHRPPLRSESPLIIKDLTNYTIHTKVKANKSTFINMLSVHSRMAPVVCFCKNFTKIYHEQFTILVKCEEDNSIIKKKYFDSHVEHDSNIDIEFDEPILMKKDCWYKISFIWPHQNAFYCYYQYGVQSRDTCYNNGKIKFEFNDVLRISDHGGSFLRGFKYCM
ncbi:BTB/POZ domain-containing protein 3-like [Nymphalis io]|uniref:BTB/POZ domain-containing protein 3-like n=1 Tax=Inachis io TaxID=171585 RepID=UPI0021695E4A|nr:BTB/POZ domain-containing protein 3-like [Nymphalis io]XP_050361960.1 BTB/POZ domain-containing protein 3-like [Nymphalis io]